MAIKLCKNNTKYFYAPDGSLQRVRLHHTDIVTVDGDTITLNTGGYKTVTTKARMNQISDYFGLGFRVYQWKHRWHVVLASKDGGYYWQEPLPFIGNSISFKRPELVENNKPYVVLYQYSNSIPTLSR